MSHVDFQFLKADFLVTVLIASESAVAAPPATPLAKDGACPSGYYASGNYCTPTASARFAVPKDGACPSGYYSSGNYCLASSDASRLAVPKLGSCPSGYYSSGNYCVGSR